MTLLNAIELEMREACRLALSYLTRQVVNRKEYLFLMETLRNAVRRADLKESGCPTGTHRSDCTCAPGRVGRNFDALKYRRRQKGYTLIELMIVVAILGILSSVATLVAGNAIAKAKEATNFGNLATMRAALAMYSTDHDGMFPQFAAGEINGGYLPLLHDTLVPMYLREIPEVKSPKRFHKDSNVVDCVWNQTGQADDEANGYGSGWRYDANPHDIGVYAGAPGFGSIRVLCTHKTLKGSSWTTF